jgi:dihydroorotate dehydrogenase/Pyruvate/2-oxoacid:ferredoxin oxidoreductase delta subunit
MADLRTQFFHANMPSPFILASGPLSYDAEGIWRAFQAQAGGVVTKTLRLTAALNPTRHMVRPRTTNLRNTLFNSEKWADLPWEQWVAHELPALRGHPGVLIASIGHTVEEAAAIAGPVAATDVVDAIELVSYTKDTMSAMVRAVRRVTDLPVLAKLTFNWGDELYGAAEELLAAGASGFTAIDSIGPTLQIDIETGRPTLGGTGNRGWMSGAAIRPVAQAVVAELAVRFQAPVVGTGGITQAEDAVEMMMVGAAALGVCTAPLLHGLGWFAGTNAKLAEWLDRRNLPNLAAIRGMALGQLHTAEIREPLRFKFEPAKCTICNQCIVLCPYAARQLLGDRPRSEELVQVIDQARCRSCGLCVEVCKTSALVYESSL